MFFYKVALAVALVFGLSLQVQAHALINNALGVKGTPQRSDVQRPSTAAPCGTVDIAQTLGTSTPVVASAAGLFSTTVVDFNAGADGSRSVTAQVDATGTGTKFVAATVKTNGNPAPTTVGSDNISVQLPAGTKCTGGANKNLCLVAFKTTAGFGNCVAVQQGAAAKRELDIRAAGTRAARAVRQFVADMAYGES